MQFRDLRKQYQVLKTEMDQAMAEVLESAGYISGRQVTELEEALARYVGVKHCITCANGTDALTLALMSWGIGEGDAVFVPDFTFFPLRKPWLTKGRFRYLRIYWRILLIWTRTVWSGRSGRCWQKES